MQELPNKIVSEIFGRAIGLLRPTIWLMAAASAIGGVVTLGTGTSILRAGKATGATAMLQNWLRAQVENVSAVRSLHFVAVDHETISFPKGSTMYIHGAKGTVAVPVRRAITLTSRTRYEFWLDGDRYRIQYIQYGPGRSVEDVTIAWDGTRFQVYGPGRVLRIWPQRPRRYIFPCPVNPALAPLEFAQPALARPAEEPWWPWLTWNRLRHHTREILSRCGEVKLQPMPGGGLWGSVSGASRGTKALYTVRVSSRVPHLVVAIRVKEVGAGATTMSRQIKYRSYRLGHRTVWLPTHIGHGRSKYLQVGGTVPPRIFTISFKLAREVVMEPSGKVIPVGP